MAASSQALTLNIRSPRVSKAAFEAENSSRLKQSSHQGINGINLIQRLLCVRSPRVTKEAHYPFGVQAHLFELQAYLFRVQALACAVYYRLKLLPSCFRASWGAL